ncbi:MAG: RNA polymerase sigma factor, partial [Planctomycetota bacterium]
KIDESGVVQQSLLEAASDRALPLGNAERTRAFLRKIVANNLADEIRKLKTQKRDVDREFSIESSLDESSARLQHLLAAGEPSPSAHCIRGESLLRLASQLALLPDDQRRAIELHHLQEMKLPEVARVMNRSRGSVASLIFRGLSRLRDVMTSSEEQ